MAGSLRNKGITNVNNPLAFAQECVFRGQQLLWNRLDKDRWKHRLGEDRGLCDPTGRFFFSSSDLPSLIASLRACSAKEKVLQAAEKICAHRFDLLGYEDLYFGVNQDIDWHSDPVHRKRSPQLWWQNVPYLDPDEVGDSKIIWELNRHQYFIVLAKAYLHSGDEKYRNEFIKQLQSWFESNSPKSGINWASSLEQAFRIIAWIWTLKLFDPLPETVLKRMYTYIALQAEHIEHNLSVYFSPNTHLTGEALALFYVGTLFPSYKRSKRWQNLGVRLLLKCLDKHILPDGGYMERSLWYHRYTLDIYLHFYILSKVNNLTLPEKVETKILQLAEFLMYASTPDKKFPLIGDDDGGRLLPLDNLESNDIRGLFSTLAILFQRGDFKFISESLGEESLWLLGPSSRSAYENLEACEPVEKSKAFETTGYFFMRSDWTAKASYLSFDCGAHGWLNMGHAHADLLSIHINKGSSQIIVDPGTMTYAGTERNVYRSADSHALIKLNNAYPAAVKNIFHWDKVPKQEFLRWSTDSNKDYVAGLMRADGWTHRRELLFVKPHYVLMTDTLTGEGKHKVDVQFPLGSGTWMIRDNLCLCKDKNTIIQLEPQILKATLKDFAISSCYGSKEQSFMLTFTGSIVLPCTLRFFINLSSSEVHPEVMLSLIETQNHILSSHKEPLC